ncbi:MAG: hypothetical protein ACLQUY_06170 [Ktedonobacterales bacterium]
MEALSSPVLGLQPQDLPPGALVWFFRRPVAVLEFVNSQRLEAAQPRLPDGRRLVLRIAGACCLTVAAHPGRAA